MLTDKTINDVWDVSINADPTGAQQRFKFARAIESAAAAAATTPPLERIAALEASAEKQALLYIQLAEAMGYESGEGGIEFSPEEWAAKLVADKEALEAKLSYRVTDTPIKLSECQFLETPSAAATAAPEQQEPTPMTRAAHRATMACVECGGVLGHTRACSKFTGYGGEVAQAPNAQQAEAQEPVATINISDDDFDLGLTDDYAFGIKRLPNGEHQLFTRPQPAQLQALSATDVMSAWVATGGFVLPPEAMDFARSIQSALAAKNGAALK
jgi:hypothetical protein